MGPLFYYILTAVVLLVMFLALVAAHEFGHFIFARLFKMGVEEFAIGFGKPVVRTWMKRTYRLPLGPGEVPEIRHGDVSRFDVEGSSRLPEDIRVVETESGPMVEETTRYTIRAWPLGGFVRIKGMFPEEDGSETTIAGGFYSKPPWQRLIVLLAGPAFSVLTGLLILIPLLMVVGTDKPINKPILGEIVKGGPADKAGLKPGDVIKSMDGKSVSTFYDMSLIVRDSPGKQLPVQFERKNVDMTTVVIPLVEANPSQVFDSNLNMTAELKRQSKIEANPPIVHINVGLVDATKRAVAVPIVTVAGVLGMAAHPSTFKESVGGPISIARVTFDVVKVGLADVLNLAAFISISVGIFNLIPVAPLDGGLIAMALAEMFRRGKRLSIQVQGVFNMVGLTCMALLLVCVFYIDVTRITSGNDPLRDPPAKQSTK